MRPPVFARMLLRMAAGPEQFDFIAGDLEEELRTQSAGWYWRQVLGSVRPLLTMRLRSSEMPLYLLTGFVPLFLLDRLWSVVYSGIPLKDGTERAPAFLVVNLLVVLVCLTMQPKVRVGLMSGCIAGALCLSVATQPFWYVGLALALPAAVRRFR